MPNVVNVEEGPSNWRTPPHLFWWFDQQVQEYGDGPFGCDVFADDDNHLCDEYYTEEEDALDPDRD